MLALGTEAPAFELPDPEGQMYSISDFASAQALLVVFICNHCPFVKHIREELSRFGRESRDLGLAMVAINSNDVENYPADSPEMMALEIEQFGYTFPYLFDESQDVAKAYQAACTPDFFLFDHDRKLVYRGQFDGSRPGNNVPVTGEDLRAAVRQVLAGQPVTVNQRPSIGCDIKWKPGNRPTLMGGGAGV
jgi:peroxiredoxin